MRRSLVILVALVLTSCAAWQKDIKPVVRTIDDIAQGMCAIFYGGEKGISVDDALKIYCRTREAWAPWIDAALASTQAGGAKALGKPVDAPAPSPQPTPQPPPKPATEGQPDGGSER